jgi:hypothetical protein
MMLIDMIMSAIDEGDLVVGVFLDFQKAFDTIKHDILLRKLHKYGIRGTAHKWLEDYLANRSQFVSFNNTESIRRNITHGVPQGSILGPLLFVLYINDIIEVSPSLTPIIFADDTNLFLRGKSLTETINTMNLELDKIRQWLNSNRLSLNITKTHYITFTSKRRQAQSNAQICINGQSIDCVEMTKFIGVILDSKLSWMNHISMTRTKVAKSMGILSKARKVLSISALTTLYYSLVYPYLTYCIEIWGSAAETYLITLLKSQKKILRIMKSLPPRSPTAPIFQELNILTIHNIYKYRVATFMFKFSRNMLPKIFDHLSV